MRTTHQSQKGFTLVELAIVMTIIGLLIGGILKGQELLANARLTATIAQVRSYESAVTTFRDTYSSVPGDMLNAQARLAGCTAVCNPPTAHGGNNVVGLINWTMAGLWPMQAIPINNPNTVPQTETLLFWKHLVHADLISGVMPVSSGFVASEWGVTHPMARLGGGFVVGYADGANPPAGSVGGNNPAGMILAIVTNPNDDLDATGGSKPMTAGRAAQIDRKMDDGRPTTGAVQPFGLTASCFTDAATQSYAEDTTGNDCGIMFRIQG